MRTPFHAALLTLAMLAPAAPAFACSVVSTYRVPTNLELVEQAETILLGIAERHVPAETGSGQGEVVVRPVELLKGESLPPEVRIYGALADDPRIVVDTSDPRDLVRPNGGALSGACTRWLFRPGMLLLLFLKRDGEGRLRLVTFPFARSAEDVPSRDALWVRAVRLYAEIAALPESARGPALVARRESLRTQREDADAALLAEDVDRQIRHRGSP